MASKKKHASGSLNQLEELLQKAGIRLQFQEEQEDPPAPPAEIPELLPGEIPGEATDEDTFSEAMNGVKRVSWKHDPHPSSEPVRKPETDTEAEERKMKQEAMDEDKG